MLRPAYLALALSLPLAASAIAGEPPTPPAQVPVVTPSPSATAGSHTAQELLSSKPEDVRAALDRLASRLPASGPEAQVFRASVEAALLASAAEREAMFQALVSLARKGAAETQWACQVADAGGPMSSGRFLRALDGRALRSRLFDIRDLVATGRSAEDVRALAAKEISGAGTGVEVKNNILIVRARPEQLDAVTARLEELRREAK